MSWPADGDGSQLLISFAYPHRRTIGDTARPDTRITRPTSPGSVTSSRSDASIAFRVRRGIPIGSRPSPLITSYPKSQPPIASATTRTWSMRAGRATRPSRTSSCSTRRRHLLGNTSRSAMTGQSTALTVEGQNLIDRLGLDRESLVRVRRYYLDLAALKQEHPEDPRVHGLSMQSFGYPDDLPDLTGSRPRQETHGRGANPLASTDAALTAARRRTD